MADSLMVTMIKSDPDGRLVFYEKRLTNGEMIQLSLQSICSEHVALQPVDLYKHMKNNMEKSKKEIRVFPPTIAVFDTALSSEEISEIARSIDDLPPGMYTYK